MASAAARCSARSPTWTRARGSSAALRALETAPHPDARHVLGDRGADLAHRDRHRRERVVKGQDLVRHAPRQRLEELEPAVRGHLDDERQHRGVSSWSRRRRRGPQPRRMSARDRCRRPGAGPALALRPGPRPPRCSEACAARSGRSRGHLGQIEEHRTTIGPDRALEDRSTRAIAWDVVGLALDQTR